MSQLQQLAERVDRLLLRHEELQRTNALLTAQVGQLTAERDSLKSRLSAARQRIDLLIDKLPSPTPHADAHPQGPALAAREEAP